MATRECSPLDLSASRIFRPGAAAREEVFVPWYLSTKTTPAASMKEWEVLEEPLGVRVTLNGMVYVKGREALDDACVGCFPILWLAPDIHPRMFSARTTTNWRQRLSTPTTLTQHHLAVR